VVTELLKLSILGGYS